MFSLIGLCSYHQQPVPSSAVRGSRQVTGSISHKKTCDHGRSQVLFRIKNLKTGSSIAPAESRCPWSCRVPLSQSGVAALASLHFRETSPRPQHFARRLLFAVTVRLFAFIGFLLTKDRNQRGVQPLPTPDANTSFVFAL